MSTGLYPKDYNPPNKGTCKVCGKETKSHDPKWLTLCPIHWQELVK